MAPDPSLYSSLSRSELFRGVLGAAAAAASFRTGAAIAQVGQPRLPPLVGAPFEHVGCRYTRCGGARVKLFYPASSASGVAAPYCTDGRETSDGMAGLVGFKQLGLSFLLGHLADAKSGLWLNAPPVATSERLPLLVYSHGFGGNMDMGRQAVIEAGTFAGCMAVALSRWFTPRSTSLLPLSHLRRPRHRHGSRRAH